MLLSIASPHSYATKMDDKEIDLENTNEGTKPRSVVITPMAWFSSQTSSLKLQITSQDGYAMVTIKDNTGIEICSQSVLANGTVQQFPLLNYPSNETYYVSIEFGAAEYTGEFNIN